MQLFARSRLALLAVVVVALLLPGRSAMAQAQEPVVEVTGRTNAGMTREGKVRLNVFLNAWKDDTKTQQYNGNLTLEFVQSRLHFNNQPALIEVAPKRVSEDASQVPLVFLFAIDVSGSMGGSASDALLQAYERRMAPLVQGLGDFVAGDDNPNVYVRLYPWGHLIPQHVAVDGSDQRLDAWEGQYLPLDETGKPALRQGIDDINQFVMQSDGNVNTALYGACLRGVQELDEAIKRDERFRNRAKPILVLLTDGENDPTLSQPEIQDLTLPRIIADLGRIDPPIPVYTIGFGLDEPRAESDLKQIAQAYAGKYFSVDDGYDAASKLLQAYEGLVEFEGNQWVVQVDTRLSEREIASMGAERFRWEDQAIEGVNDRMLLIPSATVQLSRKAIAITLAIAFVIVLIFLNIWYFTRPKEIAPADDGFRDEPDDAATPAAEARIGAVGVRQYIQAKKDDDESR